MSSYELALLLHIAGVLSFASGIVLAGAGFEVARRRDDPAEIALALEVGRIGVPLVGAGSLAVLGFGLWLVDLGGFGYGDGWITAALSLFVVALLLGAAGGRRPKRARVLASRLAADKAPVNDELRALLRDPVSLAVNYLSALIVLAILVLMVLKPY